MQFLAFLLIWPGTLLALLLGYFGHLNRLVRVAASGVVLGLPLLLYLAASPRFQWWAAAIILTNVASLAALWRERQRLAVVLFSLYPAFLITTLVIIRWYFSNP
jgi:hypothetical protein